MIRLRDTNKARQDESKRSESWKVATKSRELPAAAESTLAGALTAVDAAVPAAAAAGGAVAGALAWDAGAAYKHVATDYSKSTGTKNDTQH